MATRHKQHLASYLAHHKQVTALSKNSGTPGSAGSAPPLPGARSSRSGPRESSVSSSHHVRSKLSQSGRTTQLTGKTANLDGFLPDEMLLKIFAYLDVVSLLHASQVNKRWCALARDDSLWKTIARQYASKEKASKEGAGSGSSESSSSFHTQWKNVCIARCAKWRNQRALKLVKRAQLNPFTGLPRDTEKALKESGVTYQLSLVDTYGKESCTESSKVTLHKSSVGVTWHSLSFLRLNQVRRLRILAVCPLFYNDRGNVVKGSPYQRCLLWEADVRLSEWTTEKNALAADDQVTMYKLPGDLLMATWKADGEVAFFTAGLHYHQLVQRCMLGSPTECYVPEPHKVIPDDIDNSYGLHDYRATIELRTFHQTLWSQQFSGLHCRRHDLALGAARFTLIRHDCTVDHTPLEKSLSLPWRTELFKGSVAEIWFALPGEGYHSCYPFLPVRAVFRCPNNRITGAAWLDVTVLDERGEVFFTASSPVQAQRPSVKGSDFEYEETQHLLMKYEGNGATVQMQIGKLDYGKAFVRHLELNVKASAINDWFGTKYLTP